jgi:hypothetical protein
MTIAKDSRSYPTLAVLQTDIYGLGGDDVTYYVYMLSWECFKAVKRGEPFPVLKDRMVNEDHSYGALKQMFYAAGHKVDIGENAIREHPHLILSHLYTNHELGAREHGYWGIDGNR